MDAGEMMGLGLALAGFGLLGLAAWAGYIAGRRSRALSPGLAELWARVQRTAQEKEAARMLCRIYFVTAVACTQNEELVRRTRDALLDGLDPVAQDLVRRYFPGSRP